MRPLIRTNSNRIKRHWRIRKKVRGTAERPRLCLFRSLKHLEAQLIDDGAQKTILGFSTCSAEYRQSAGLPESGNVKAASLFGKFVAGKAKEKGIGKIVFDRAGCLYHGRVKAFAEAAREGGLVF
ncbi:MAG: 50S ribosomal protein L18 [Candidatus Omnitrophica bacterium]|nr:50S ribosomal protein L18 [Candidatus Omnitrophota bacterium]